MKDFNGNLVLNGKTYRHVFFDMDNTLTPSRSFMTGDMQIALSKLMLKKNVAIVSGSQESQVWKQVPGLFKGKISLMIQNGNNAYSAAEDKYLWERKLSSKEKKEIMNHISRVQKRYSEMISNVRKEKKLIEDRGCQISFSFVGHNALLQDKQKFDPKGNLRKEILANVPLISKTVGVKIGGTTCFDYNQIGKNKGYNILEWMKYFSWRPEDSLYVGDALFPGGNDDTVLGICDTLQVSDYRQTLAAIKKMI
ncbi:MAG: HAD-IIB family hydrolase [Candidatus Taylorbacteria bacterium]|nr:HAD-IIB family hydrolase [Candidatus Taylorbacteria bacterium]